jgi:hypothetical protein
MTGRLISVVSDHSLLLSASSAWAVVFIFLVKENHFSVFPGSERFVTNHIGMIVI